MSTSQPAVGTIGDESESDPQVGGVDVLLVDSDEEFVEMFEERMSALGCSLVTVAVEANLGDVLHSHEPQVLLLSDDGPGGSAIEAVANLRASERWSRLPVFVLGRRLGTETALRAYAAGVDAVMSKTRSSALTELTARIVGVVGRTEDPPARHDAPETGRTEDDIPDVIVVEDDPALIEMLDYSLSNQGYDLAFFSNGREALDGLLKLATGERRPVVLLDVDLPGMDGFRILQELTAQKPGAFQVIMATMHSSQASQVLAIESGAVDYMVKPLNIPIALAKIERLVRAGASR